jgi:hypothetical protein
LTVRFRLSRILRLSRAPFTNFSFTRWNFGYHRAFHKLFFHTMEFWLSRSLSQTFLSHDGISAITEPFTNFSFTRWNFGYQEPFTNFSFTRWNFGYHRAFLTFLRTFSHDGIQSIMEHFSHFHGFFLVMEFRLSQSLSHTLTEFFS